MKRLVQFISVSVVLCLSAVTISACTMNPGNSARDSQNGQMEQQRYQPAPLNQNMGMEQNNRQRNNNDRDHNWIAESQEAAELISDMQEIEAASVLLTNRNAYVAVIVENELTDQLSMRGNRAGTDRVDDKEVSEELKQQIAQQVQSVEPNVQNVYVSANPDFVGQINNYMTDLREGRPLTGLMDELNDMVGRMFPVNSLNNQKQQ